ncbi:MAG: hypothetical protein ACE5JN_09240 [Candidatus Methylomirabilia bacterium]
MKESALDTVTQRLERLEREVRWWKILGGAAMAVLAVVLLAGARGGTVAEEVRARRFIVVGDDGTVRADLSALPNGYVGLRVHEEGKVAASIGVSKGYSALTLRDKDTDAHAWLGVGPNNPPHILLADKDSQRIIELRHEPGGRMRLEFYSETWKTRVERRRHVELSVAGDGSPLLMLADKNGMPRGALRVGRDGESALDLYDKSRRIRARLGVRPDGMPSVKLLDQGARARAMLLVTDDGLAQLSLLDAAHKRRVGISVSARGSPSLELADRNERVRAVLGHAKLQTTFTGAVEKRPASSLVLFGSDGNVVWKAP